ncbi:hypothetical protein APHAL10511_001676 [Amanita phalloides]|nr:hypothetical protein APHAL10511_001676 [Amanita phalloides]
MNIQPLPLPTRAKLRSTQILSSLPHIVSELLQNALDANARHVDVGVDNEQWECWVRDDGIGISKDALGVIGEASDGGRYNTSKRYATGTINALETFGFRGEALASIANLSCLEICSRTLHSRDTWSVIVKGGKSLYKGSAIRWRRESPGTTVHVRDAFYNLPVRRRSHPPPSRVLEQIRRELESYALVFTDVSFSLQNLQNVEKPGPSKDSTWRIPKTGSTLTTFQHLYGKSLAKRVEEINSISGDMKLKGFISLVGAPSKMYQFLYVNRHLMVPCDLHKAADSVFAKSTFHKNAPDGEDDTGMPASIMRRSPRKGEKKPIYVLDLTLPPETIDNCVEPDKSAIHIRDIDTVAAFLASSIRGFLTSHGYVTESIDEALAAAARPGPARQRRRVRVTHCEETDDSKYDNTLTDVRGCGLTAAQLFIGLTNDDEYQTWTDDRTGQTFVINSRTGNTCSATVQQTIGARLNDGRRTLSLQTSTSGPERSTTPNWLKDALKNNPVYVAKGNEIPVIHNHNDCQRQGGIQSAPVGPVYRFGKNDLAGAKVVGQVDRKFIACLIAGKETLAVGDSLERERNENDVLDGLTLILIDQHAADERIRVEQYLKGLCQGFLYSRKYGSDSKQGVKVRNLEPPLPLLLTRHEALRLASSRDLQEFLSWWGLHFCGLSTDMNGTGFDSDTGNSHGYFQIFAKGIPLVISDKLMMKDELRNLVRSILGYSDILRLSHQKSDESEILPLDELCWLNGLRYCPEGILDLINSKACRGAIMFNDSLSVKQCEKLVCQLSETVFPFQCAHGRPSLVPVANTGTLRGGRREATRLGWSRLEQ